MRLHRQHRAEDLALLLADRLRLQRRRRLHRGERQHLEEVGHDHVAEGSGGLVEAGPLLEAERLGYVDLDVVDVVAVPDRLEEAVGEAERQDVLRRLLAEEVVDPEDLLLVEHLVQLGVERDGRGEVGAERLLHDDPAALDQAGVAELVDDRPGRPSAARSGSAAGWPRSSHCSSTSSTFSRRPWARRRRAPSGAPWRTPATPRCRSSSPPNSSTAARAKSMNESRVCGSSEVPTTRDVAQQPGLEQVQEPRAAACAGSGPPSPRTAPRWSGASSSSPWAKTAGQDGIQSMVSGFAPVRPASPSAGSTSGRRCRRAAGSSASRATRAVPKPPSQTAQPSGPQSPSASPAHLDQRLRVRVGAGDHVAEDLHRLGAGDAVPLVDDEERDAGRAVRRGLPDVGRELLRVLLGGQHLLDPDRVEAGPFGGRRQHAVVGGVLGAQEVRREQLLLEPRLHGGAALGQREVEEPVRVERPGPGRLAVLELESLGRGQVLDAREHAPRSGPEPRRTGARSSAAVRHPSGPAGRAPLGRAGRSGRRPRRRSRSPIAVSRRRLPMKHQGRPRRTRCRYA